MAPKVGEAAKQAKLAEAVAKEQRLKTALKILSTEWPAYSIRQASIDYNVPLTTLNYRFNNITVSRTLSHIHLQKLHPQQERALVKRLKESDDYGYPATREVLIEMANALLPPDEEVGINWYRSFESRNPDIRTVLSCSLDRQRALQSTQSGYETYYRNLAWIIQTFNIPPENIWNFDEKGFIIGLCNRFIVYARPDRKNPGKLTQTGTRQSVTSGETISAAGQSLPPYIINKGALHNVEKFKFIQPGVLDDASFANAPEGVMHSILSIDYLRDHFDKFSRQFMKPASEGGSDHRLLIWDSHISHVSLDVRYFGVENKIHLLTYPGHQTHKLQPLDVAIFSPLEHYYQLALEKWTRQNPSFAMSQSVFFSLLDHARKLALTVENIQSAFRTTGIHPLSRRRILELATGLEGRIEKPPTRNQHLLDTPPQQKDRIPKATLFKTPKPLRTVTVDSPSDNHHIRQMQLKARRGEASKEELQSIVVKLSGLAIRTLADSEIQRNLVTDLSKKKQKQGEKKDLHHLSHSTVLTQPAAIKLAEQQQAERKQKTNKQRRNQAKKEAKKMGKTWDEYITWYNSQRKPKPPLRTQLGPDGELMHIPAEESDTEWQIPSRPGTPPLRVNSQTQRPPRTPRTPSPSHNQPEPFEIDASDLALIFRQTPAQVVARTQRRRVESRKGTRVNKAKNGCSQGKSGQSGRGGIQTRSKDMVQRGSKLIVKLALPRLVLKAVEMSYGFEGRREGGSQVVPGTVQAKEPESMGKATRGRGRGRGHGRGWRKG